MKNGNPKDPLNRKSIRKALRCWKNSQQLGEQSLARLGVVEARRKAAGYCSTPIGYGVALRDVLRHAIRNLKPDEEPPDPFEKRWRLYLLLNEAYISGRSPEYISAQMGIARSTYDHAQASALDALADLLREWDQHGSPEDPNLAFLRPEKPRFRRALFLLPPRPDHPIVGRSSLLQGVKNLLHVDDQPLAGMSGLPGVGKTTLAIELAHDPDVRERYEDGVLWVGLGREPDLLVLLSQWAVALGLPLEEINKLDRLTDRAKAIHAAIGMDRMLLVIDDVWNAHEGLTFKIGGANCAHLMTTRLPKVAHEMAGEGAIELCELDEVDGLRLLDHYAPEVTSAEPDEARLLVNEVGGLPLALVLMGRYLRREARSGQMRRLKAALERLKDAGERLRLSQIHSPLEQQPSLLLSEPLSLKAAIDISVQALDDVLKSALLALSVLPPKPNSFSEASALVVASVSTEVLDNLVDFGLLESREPDRYTLNRSISEFAGLALEDEEAYRRFVDYYVEFVEAHQKDFPAIEIETQNILAALHVAFERKIYAQLIRGANAFYPFLEAVGLLDQAQMHLTRAEKAARQIDDMYGLITTLERMGRTAQRRGDYDTARKIYGEGFQLARKHDDAKSMCALLQGLGVVAFSRGDYQEAEKHYLQGLDLARTFDQRERISAILSNLGTLAFSRGEIDQAETHFRDGLAAAREIEDRAHISSILMNLGVVLARRRAFEEADVHFQESLELARAEGNRKNISFLLTNLGTLASDRGDEKQAEMYIQDALTLAREMDDRARISHLLANLGGLATTGGDHDAAEGYLKEGHTLAREIGHREYTTLILTNMGVLMRERGDDDQAESCFAEALELAKEMGHRRFISVVLSNRGELYLGKEDWQKAEVDFEVSGKIAREIDLKEFIAVALYGLARVARARGDHGEAIRLGKESLEIFETINHPKSSDVTEWLKQ
ncbi:MAG TPA: tetratricopeptide repeat protein [Anaerolineae bacterium]|nr:tetratricopeptide repeat protein [Anaerolineae bacterium]